MWEDIQKNHAICQDEQAKHAYFAESSIVICNPTESQAKHATYIWSECPNKMEFAKCITPLGFMRYVDYLFLIKDHPEMAEDDTELWATLYLNFTVQRLQAMYMDNMKNEAERKK